MSTNGDEQRNYHQLNDDKNKAIIQQLADDGDDADTALVIKSYTIGSSDKEIRKQLDDFRVPILKKAALYLGLKEEDGEPRIYKKDVINFIIRRIETLLMDLCGICGDYFNNSLQDTPLFTCLICKQGSHQDCFEEINTVLSNQSDKIRAAFHFICTSCIGEFENDPSTAPKSKKSPIKPGNTKKPSEDDDDEVTEEVSDVRTNAGLVIGDPPGDTIITEHKTEEKVDSAGSNDLIDICPAYKWGRCPDYETCQYRHPPRCWNWLSEGKCSYKRKCRYHHPPLCRNSISEKKCFNENCRYFHLSKTMRYNRDDEQLKTALNSANYHAQHEQQVPSSQHINQQYHEQLMNAPQLTHNHPNQLPHPGTSRTIIQPQPPTVPSYPVHQTTAMHQPHHPPSSNLNQNDIAFLVKSIKDIKDDLGKEIAELKKNLSVQVNNANRPQIITATGMPQTMPNPYYQPNVMLPLHHQLVPPQRS